ncbi:DNA-binding protein Fis [Candidatus Nitrotoga sp. BS]|nr:DNA-binding protein Fis [Candidatus Nitrotoga sp. BS]
MTHEDDCLLGENDVAKYIRKAVGDYFKDLDGENPSCAVYDMVMNCVEKPLIEAVLHHAGGNQTRAAELLGLNRNTLRKKIQQHSTPSETSNLRPNTRSEQKSVQRSRLVKTNEKKN